MPKYKLSISAIIISILVPLAITHAAYNDVTLATDVTITVGSYNLTVSSSNAVVESIVVNSSDFIATMPVDSSLIVRSTGKYIMAVSGIGGNDYSQECSSSANTLTITVGAGSTRSVKVIPTSTVCEVASVSSSGSRSGSSGSSGGGSSYSPPAPATVVAQAVTPPAMICPVGITCTPVGSASTISVNFTSDLSRGMSNDFVSKLQQILAADPSIYPEGLVTGYFGPATESAVKRFQAKYGIDQLGRVGPATRMKLNSLSASNVISQSTPSASSVQPVPAVKAPSTGVSATFSANLSKGDSNADVKRLQQLLNSSTDTQIASDGPGSPGNETDTFGSLTETAVGKFQLKYNIAQPGDSGFGTVGPKTRVKLLEVFEGR